MTEECKAELRGRMIPFWLSLIDTRNGGFIGEHDGKNPIPAADKGSIYHARLLWFFSKCGKILSMPDLLETAGHVYRFIRDNLIDPVNGGVYWSVDYRGKPKDTDKHAYALAFTLYGLSAYCDAGGNQEACALAQSVFDCLENKCRTHIGYNEQFDIAFNPLVNVKLSETLFTPKTMNTMLHIMEAYTEFVRTAGHDRGKEALEYIYTLFMRRVFSDDKGRLDIYFDEELRPQSDEKSYGHDIEASWLLTEASLTAGYYEVDIKRILRLVNVTLAEGFDGEALMNERKNGIEDTNRVWWVQAEAVVALVNAYSVTSDTGYLQKARKIWEYIKSELIGEKEWFWGKTKTGKPLGGPLAGIWKGPYHNGRMFLEVIKRNVDF
jgi:mannobiose 2-epimerase